MNYPSTVNKMVRVKLYKLNKCICMWLPVEWAVSGTVVKIDDEDGWIVDKPFGEVKNSSEVNEFIEEVERNNMYNKGDNHV